MKAYVWHGMVEGEDYSDLWFIVYSTSIKKAREKLLNSDKYGVEYNRDVIEKEPEEIVEDGIAIVEHVE